MALLLRFELWIERGAHWAREAAQRGEGTVLVLESVKGDLEF